MYTDSVEHESEFLRFLLQSSSGVDINTKTVKVIKGVECPKCHKGTVLTELTPYINENHSGLRGIHIRHFCDSCNEEFVISRIRSEIFLNTPYQMAEKIETPYGVVHVDLNEKRIPFRYRVENLECIIGTGPNQNKTEKAYIIDLDFTELHSGDIVFCGFDKDVLEYNDSDERCVLYSSVVQDPLLGFCAYEPDGKVGIDQCFDFYSFAAKGVEYKVYSDPAQFNERERYWSKIASIALMWIDRKDYEDSDDRLFDLTCLIS